MRALLMLSLIWGGSLMADVPDLTKEENKISLEELITLNGNPYLLEQTLFLSGDKGNGGDLCENEIETISADIERWILEEGHLTLKYPENITAITYSEKMLEMIRTKRVTCIDKVITFANKEKMCVNFFDSENTPLIVCNREKLMKSDINEQYRIIHHELAGLSEFEVSTEDGESDYSLSNQITGYLEQELVTRLAVKPYNKELLNYIDESLIYTISKDSFFTSVANINLRPNTTRLHFTGGLHRNYQCTLEYKSSIYFRVVKAGFKLKVTQTITKEITFDYEARMIFDNAGTHSQPFYFMECRDVGSRHLTIKEMRYLLREVMIFSPADPLFIE